MNKRNAVEYFYHQGMEASYAYDKLWEKYPDLTLEWVTEVYEELDQEHGGDEFNDDIPF